MILSRHAIKRADEMGLSWAQLLEIISEPEVTYAANERKYGPGARVAQRGVYALGYRCQDGDALVMTVLHRTQEVYTR